MSTLRRFLAGSGILLLLTIGWLWWTRPVAVEIASYVPAGTLIYFEAEDLTEIARALASTDALRNTSRGARPELDWAGSRWLTRFVSLTGLASGRAVVLSRSQVAVAVLGFEAQEEQGAASLRFSPRLAVVAETHTPEWRVKPAVEQLAGELARRVYGSPSVERKEVDGTPFVTWVSPADSRRRIVAAVSGSLAVVGNDEGAVKSCLEARDGAAGPSLAGDVGLARMRARFDAGGDAALAFGYAPKGSAAKVLEILAPAFVGGVAEESRVQSLLATMLPQVADKVLGDMGWSTRLVEGRVEDQYFVSLADGIAQRLQAPFTPHPEWGEGAAAVLPHDTYQFTQYNFRNPEMAWRGFGATLSSQFDVTRGPIITLALEALVRPYGVSQPRVFLRGVGPDVVTARLRKESVRKVLVVEAFDRDALLAQARRHLGPRTTTERVGRSEVFVSHDPELGAAALVSGHLVLGDAEDIRRCVEAAAQGRTLRGRDSYNLLGNSLFAEPAFTRTLSDDGDTVARVSSLLKGSPADAAAQNGRTPNTEESRARYSYSETRLTADGFEKKTRSAFGLFGELISRATQRN